MKVLIRHIIWVSFHWIFISCTFQPTNKPGTDNHDIKETVMLVQGDDSLKKQRINNSGVTISERFNTLDGYRRVPVESNSFAAFLRILPLKPHGSVVRYFDGQVKPPENIYLAVVDYDIGEKNLLQCADAIMKLRGEYLYQQQRFDDIVFNFTSGDTARFSYYAKGYRPVILNNQVTWSKNSEADSSYNTFLNYMELVYMYSGTYSLDKALVRVTDPNDITIGDVFIQGGFPGHAVLVADVAEHIENKKKIFLLVQSYMPAQEIHILCNPQSSVPSPWFQLEPLSDLVTPEWVFKYSELKRFRSKK